MGHMLSTAVSSQYIQRYGDDRLRVGSSHMQGCRPTMEDSDTVLLELPGHPRLSFFGVYDGHAGEQVSEYLSKALVAKIAALADPMDPEQVREAVMAVDKDIGEDDEIKQSGSTACFVILERPTADAQGEAATRYRLLASNVGDSRALILRPDGSFQELTSDHKPDLPKERNRIEEAGGTVTMGRVDGQLAMSRAMGDFIYKENPQLSAEAQKVNAVADVVVVDDLRAGDSVLVFCDGVVEQLSNEAVVEFVHAQQSGSGKVQGHGGPLEYEGVGFQDPTDPGAIMYNLLHHSVTSGSLDNHSAILIQLKSGEDYAREPEFVAGPFRPFQDRDRQFRDAYLEDARRHGIEDLDQLKEMASVAEARLPKSAREAALHAGAGDALGDPMGLLRLMTGGGNGDGEGGAMEFEQRMQLLEMLSGGQLQFVRPGDPGYDDEEEEEEEEDEDDEEEEEDDDEDEDEDEEHETSGDRVEVVSGRGNDAEDDGERAPEE